MDLKSLNTRQSSEEGTSVELEHPVTKDPIIGKSGKPWSITVRGEDSEAVRSVIKKQHNKRMERLRKGKKDYSDADSIESENVEKLVAATIGWNLEIDDEPLPYSPDKAKEIYGDAGYSWIVEQVQSAMQDRQRFFTSASKS